MQVSVERTDPCEIELNIEVDVESVAKTVERVFGEISKSTQVPGFRKGKAPRQLLERYVSPETVRRRTAEAVIPPAYEEALTEQGIEPYADPDIEVVKFEDNEPFVFKAVVPLPPKVELGEYKGIEIERKAVEVTDSDIDDQLSNLRENSAKSAKVEDRGSRKGDILVAEIGTAPEGEEIKDPKRSVVEIGKNVPDFDDNVVDMKVGDSREFKVKYPEEFHNTELAGKTMDFSVKAESINERIVPELNDEFAKSVGNFATLDDMRKNLREYLEKSGSDAADRDVENKLIEELLNRSKIDFPKVLVDHDLEHDFADLKAHLERQKISLEDYLARIGKKKEEFVEDMRARAAKRVSVGLLLGKIIEEEKLEVTDADLDAEILRLASEQNVPKDSVEMYIEAQGGRESLRRSMLSRKVIDFLKSVSVIK